MIIYTDHKNLTCKKFNADIVLRWKLILEYYVPDIKYIKGENNIGADALSKLPSSFHQKTTQTSTYQKEIMSEINGI